MPVISYHVAWIYSQYVRLVTYEWRLASGVVGEWQEGGSREGSIGARTSADCRGDMPDTSLFRRKGVCTSDRVSQTKLLIF